MAFDPGYFRKVVSAYECRERQHERGGPRLGWIYGKVSFLVVDGRLHLNRHRTKHPEVLGQVSCFLVAQLGHRNPVIKGIASMQVRILLLQFNRDRETDLEP